MVTVDHSVTSLPFPMDEGIDVDGGVLGEVEMGTFANRPSVSSTHRSLFRRAVGFASLGMLSCLLLGGL